MTSGVPFHYAGNVKAQLSQWLYPWCKGNSVISFFPLLSLSLFFPLSSSLSPSFSFSRQWRYLSEPQTAFFLFLKFTRHVLLSRRVLGERQMMERGWKRFMGRNRIPREVRERGVDVFERRLNRLSLGRTNRRIDLRDAKNFLLRVDYVYDIVCKIVWERRKKDSISFRWNDRKFTLSG